MKVKVKEEGGRRNRRRSLLKMVCARGVIPNEMGPTRCRAGEGGEGGAVVYQEGGKEEGKGSLF